MLSQKRLIERGNWDYLIILDACRYDYFKKIYKKYLRGKLLKVISSGSETSEWARNTFKTRYEDVVYLSTNANINSKIAVCGFRASDHFFRVIDVWDWRWDYKIDSVHPNTVNGATIATMEIYPNKRLIIHYLQPHYPYYDEEFLLLKDKIEANIGVRLKLFKSIPPILQHSLDVILSTFFTGRKIHTLKNLLGVKSLPEDVWMRRLGEMGILTKMYEKNLHLVLKHISQLIKKLPGKTVVTADHGDLLGEGGVYGHPAGRRDRLLVEVPWLEVKTRI